MFVLLHCHIEMNDALCYEQRLGACARADRKKW
jgi:hypothetical protein